MSIFIIGLNSIVPPNSKQGQSFASSAASFISFALIMVYPPTSSFASLANATAMFQNCTSITDEADADLYWNNISITSYSNCFLNNTSRPNYASIPAAWGGGGV